MTRLVDRRTAEGLWGQYLSKSQPRLMRQLARVWQKQADTVTIEDMRAAVASGKVPSALLDRWQNEYTKFVRGSLTDEYEKAWDASRGTFARAMGERLGVRPGSDTYLEKMDEWIKARGADVLQGFNTSQLEAMNNLLRFHIVNDPLSPRELAKVISPVIPLTPRQSLAVSRLRQKLKENGVTGRDLERRVGEYARRQQVIRAKRIARTELASAYNQGGLATMQSAIDDGDLAPGATKEWLTAEDERVCPICGPLDDPPDNVQPLNEPFTRVIAGRNRQGQPVTRTFSAQAPPIHPNCRCTLIFDAEGAIEQPAEPESQESLRLSDEERKKFVSDTYPPGTRLAPDGEPVDMKNLDFSLQEDFRNPGPYTIQDENNIRMELSRLASEYGIPSTDILNHGSRPARGDNGHPIFQTTDAGRYRVRSLRGAYGTHSYAGQMTLTPSVHKSARGFAQGGRGDANWNSFTTIVHEQLHGSSLITAEQYSSRFKFWGALEEFSTESAAQEIMRDKFGMPWQVRTTGYDGLVSNMDNVLMDAMGISRKDARTLLGRASVRFKRLPQKVNSQGWTVTMQSDEAMDELVSGIDGWDKLSPEKQKEIRRDLKDVLMDGSGQRAKRRT